MSKFYISTVLLLITMATLGGCASPTLGAGVGVGIPIGGSGGVGTSINVGSDGQVHGSVGIGTDISL